MSAALSAGLKRVCLGSGGSKASLGFPLRSVLMFSVPRVLAVSGRRERDVLGAVLAARGYRVSHEGGRRSVCVPGLGDAASWDRLVLLDVDSFLAVIVLIWAVREDVGSKIIWKCVSGIR